MPRDGSANHIRLSVDMLPSNESGFFRDSSFSRNGQNRLPTPAQVRENQISQYYGAPPPVRFPSLNLLVKYGSHITIAEGQCLWAIRHLLSGAITVPEVYGWCKDQDEVFIFMELIDGVTLESRWESLPEMDRIDICEQLRKSVAALRQLKQDPRDQFVGKCFYYHFILFSKY